MPIRKAKEPCHPLSDQSYYNQDYLHAISDHPLFRSKESVLKDHRPCLLKRSSLRDPERIERLRWRILERYNNWQHEISIPAFNRVGDLGEAFIPVELCNNDDEFPTRLSSDRHGISRDYAFFEYEESPCGNSPLEKLAAIGSRIEWEQTILPGKLARVTEEKLTAGKAYDLTADGFFEWSRRIGCVNSILAISINETAIIPRATNYDYRRSHRISLNGRIYTFKNYTDVEVMDGWPKPDHFNDVITVHKFGVDEGLLGHSKKTVLTRLGEPPLCFVTKKMLGNTPNVWVYGSHGIRFTDDGCVEKILDPKSVSRILKQAK